MEGNKGFTLIELLIVIAIVAILSVVVILTLNPAELLRQARDSNRVSDLETLNKVIQLYLIASGGGSLTTDTRCYATATSTVGGTQATCGGRFSTWVVTSTVTSSRSTAGTGWIPINFTGVSGGAGVSQLPIDPVNDATYYYAFAASSTLSRYEINAKMESSKYTSGSNNLSADDGGSSSTIYEVGTKLDI